MKRFLSLAISLLVHGDAFSQTDTIRTFSFQAYGELYYSYDFSEPQNHEKPSFVYNHKRHNEVNANLILLQGRYQQKNQRASLGLMTGNYAQYNLSSESVLARVIYEANIGVKLSANRQLWLDAGVMPSHIGFESAISADCWTLTRSILADNSPYYETGIRISNTSKNNKLYLAVLYLNGWQKIQKPDFIQQPSFGLQLNYKPSAKLTVNYSNFVGTDQPDSLESMRQYHNFYMQYEPSQKVGLQAGFDFGAENTLGKGYDIWYSPVLIIRTKLSDKTAIAVRGEYYEDRNEIIIKTGGANGFNTLGVSTNFDYAISDEIKFRIEGKLYHSSNRIYTNDTSRDNYSITTNMTIRL